jgi:hypothetical protein
MTSGPDGELTAAATWGLLAAWAIHDTEELLIMGGLAEACDVPVRWSCRTGVCHNCGSGLLSGEVRYDPEPVDPPAAGNVLICSARPRGPVVLDG